MLTVVVVAALATATFVEKMHPEVRLYDQWWFAVLLALIGMAAVVSIVQGKMWHRWHLLLIHAAVPVILLGGALTTWTGRTGTMQLQPGMPSSTYIAHSGTEEKLPFSITLERFEIIPYEGTQSPMDFASHVSIDGHAEVISMNHIARHRSYRFYQADYGEGGTSLLRVSHDPLGIPVAYAGFAMLIVGMVGMMVSRKGLFRQLLKGGASAVAILVAMAGIHTSAWASPQTLPRETADRFGRIEVMYQGRLCPVQTLAKDFTTKLTGKSRIDGLTPEQVLCGYLFFYPQWVDAPIIKVKGAGEWQLEGEHHTVHRHSTLGELYFLDGARLTPATDKNIRAAAEKVSLVRMLMNGRLLKIYPVQDTTGTMGWYGQNDQLPLNTPDDEFLFIRRSTGYMQELVLQGNYDELNRVLDKLITYQQQRVPYLTSPAAMHRQRAERLYNSLTAGRWVAMLCITLGLLCFAWALARMWRKEESVVERSALPRFVAIVAMAYVLLLSLYLLSIFVLRWHVGGHVPVAGGFDSMTLMSLLLGVLTLCLARRYPLALPAGMMAMGFCQLVAMLSGSNPPVTNLMPVLNSPLLTAHVSLIMCSYALFFFIALNSVAGLIIEGGNRSRALATKANSSSTLTHLQRATLLLLCPAVLLLASGIIIGALWANVSWGTYWSWDPKEVWALITLIIYALPLHRTLGLHRNPRLFHLYCLLALLSVAITYFGVNLILGGMHAYN